MRAQVVVALIFVLYYVVAQHEQATPHFRYADGNTRGRLINSREVLAATGYIPSQVKSYYNLPTDTAAGTGKTIGIVDAYAAPYVESDLGVFTSTFGLPSCTTANGCFTKVDSSGGQNFVTAPSGQDWNGEIALDVQWAHALAPGAKKILCLAASSSLSDLMACVNYLKTRVQYVSMSFGTSEAASMYTIYNAAFVQSGVSFFASTGDSGPQVSFPAAVPTVVAVGGTSLTVSGTTISETVWASTGGGCSSYQARPTTQTSSVVSGVSCAKRSVPDISFLADPNTGVRVYNSYGLDCTKVSCWAQIGGTSLSAPCIAAISAVTGLTVDLTQVYSGSSITFRDITSGSSTNSNGVSYSARTGYDLCTGRGSWINAISAVTSAPSGSTTTQAPGVTTKAPGATTTKAVTTTLAAITTQMSNTTTPAPTPYDPLKEILKIFGSSSTTTVNIALVVVAVLVAL